MYSEFRNLPLELRETPQWAIAGGDGAPYRIDSNGKLRLVSVNDTHLLHSFEEVEQFVEQSYKNKSPVLIGFVLSKNDPFTCIDLDVKDGNSTPDNPEKWTSLEQQKSYDHIVHSVSSYTEMSRSGVGFHIWLKANIGAGVRRGGVEIYSQERFIICTGDTFLDYPLVEANDFFNQLVDMMRQFGSQTKHFDLDANDEEQTLSDEQVLEMAANAGNREKYEKLLAGDWEGYPSQSEADLALLSMYTFYSKNNEQCRRLFRLSGLGQREKATKDNRHLDIMLRMRRADQFKQRQAEQALQQTTISTLTALRQQAEQVLSKQVESSVEALTAQCASVLVQSTETEEPLEPSQSDSVKNSVAALTEQCRQAVSGQQLSESVTRQAQQAIASINTAAPVALAAQCGYETELTGNLAVPPSGGLDWPPGQVGAVARYIYSVSHRPVHEISIAAALAFFAGIVGKCYNVESSGLNLYIILIARSAVGKEAMNSGISKLLSALTTGNDEARANSFFDFNDYVSGPALRKALPEKQCFLNINGEFGKKLSQMAEGREGALTTLRTLMTDLYQKSGKDSIVGGAAYSNKENGSDAVRGVAYSLLGETTPQTFYDCLTPSMMEDGFLSRFTMIKYNGERPNRNKNPDRPVPPALITYLQSLMVSCSRQNALNQVTQVQLHPTADKMLDKFCDRCDDEIYGVTDEGIRQMWNRAHLKAQRMAAVLAVADNDKMPVIYKDHADWAIKCVLLDIKQMKAEMKEGNIGAGDDARIRKCIALIEDYVKRQPAKSYNIPENMWDDGVIPHNFFNIRLQRSTNFIRHKLGATTAIRTTLKELVTMGYISELPKAEATVKYGTSANCYKVIRLDAY